MSERTSRLSTALGDRYRIERELGQGGMATVYLAKDLKHGRDVAVKVLRPELASVLGPDRFLREIEIAASLNHPHILGLIDSGDADGFLYYVMPYVAGETLRDRIDREKQLPIEDAIEITEEVADALGYAHSHGVVHRDIKPENVMISAGHAVVTDFGIARAVAQTDTQQLTETGMSVGTPAYMSPEQASGQSEVDGRSDIYSLACVLYEMLVGEPPHTGVTAQAILAKKLTDSHLGVRVVRETVPEVVDGAINKALSKVPADRFRTAAQFVEDLKTGRHSAAVITGTGRPSQAAIPQTGTSRKWVAATAVVIGAVGISAIVYLGRDAAPDLPPMTRSQQTHSGNINGLALAPDGQTIAYTTWQRQLIVRDALEGGGELVRVEERAADPVWTPDGTSIVYRKLGSDTLYTIPKLSGDPRRFVVGRDLAYGFANSGAAMVGHDKWIYIGDDPASVDWYAVDPSSGTNNGSFYQTPDAVTVFGGAGTLSASPDGRWLAYVGVRSALEGVVGLIPLDGGEGRILVEEKAMFIGGVARLAWSSTGDAVFYRASTGAPGENYIRRVAIDPNSGTPQDDRVVFDELTVHNFDPSPDLSALAVIGGTFALNVDTGSVVDGGIEMGAMTTGTAWTMPGDFSPDGERLATARPTGLGNRTNVVTIRSLTGDTGERTYPLADLPCCLRWSPDGSKIALYTLDARGVATLGVLDLETEDIEAVGRGSWFSFLDWSEDGGSILFLNETQTAFELLELASGEARAFVQFEQPIQKNRAVVSPDGSRIAFDGNNTEFGPGIFVTDPDGGPPTLVDPDGWFPLLWDDDRLVIQAATRLVEVEADGSNERLVGESEDLSGCGGLSVARQLNRVMCGATLVVMDLWYVTNWTF